MTTRTAVPLLCLCPRPPLTLTLAFKRRSGNEVPALIINNLCITNVFLEVF
jgi:hypothetical protein